MQKYYKWPEAEKIQKFIDEIQGDCDIKETYNRFIMLWLAKTDISQTDAALPDSELGLSGKYPQIKLKIATAILAIIDKSDIDSIKRLWGLKQFIIGQGWSLKHGAVAANIPQAVTAIETAFSIALGISPRNGDFRILLQLVSPKLWIKTEISDFIIETEDIEIVKLEKICDQMGEDLIVDANVLIIETLKYLKEHMEATLLDTHEMEIERLMKLSLS